MLVPETTDFYQAHLNRVSRSFALCIAVLEEPLRLWVSQSYLICRVLDTIEDCTLIPNVERASLFEQMDAFLQKPPNASALKTFTASFAETIPEGEKALLDDLGRLLAGLSALDAQPQELIVQSALTMSRGMRLFTTTMQKRSATFVLTNMQELNRYCYVVAGLVGILLWRLHHLVQPDRPGRASTIEQAVHFGLFLQKINILKDQRTDAAEGRFFIADRDAVVASLRGHAEGAGAFLCGLPSSALGFRIFCAWSLFLGAASLPHIEAGFAEKGTQKITRAETLRLLEEVRDVAADDVVIKRHLRAFLEALPTQRDRPREPTVSQAPPPPADKAFSTLFDIELTEAGQARLGLS